MAETLMYLTVDFLFNLRRIDCMILNIYDSEHVSHGLVLLGHFKSTKCINKYTTYQKEFS